MTLSNMSAELGAQVGLIAPDEVTAAWLQAACAPTLDVSGWHTDDDAAITRHEFDADTLAPYVAAPHSPANADVVGRYSGTPVDAS